MMIQNTREVIGRKTKRELERQPSPGQKESRLLAVTADLQVREVILDLAHGYPCNLVFQESPNQFREDLVENLPCDAVLIDLPGPAEEYLELLAVVKEICPGTEVIFISPLAGEQLWIESLRHGAYDFLPKPVDKTELRRVVMNALEKVRLAQLLH
jgi:DNA-binding NtrC family response regulator